MTNRFSTPILLVCAAIGVACGSERVFVPDRTVPSISGEYDLTAPITSFDPAWEDLTGYRYTAVLTLRQDSPVTFVGTYADLQVVRPGESSDWKYTGFVRGTLYPGGRVVIELIGGNHTWTSWYGEGKRTSRQMVGEFGCCVHIFGTFTVVPR